MFGTSRVRVRTEGTGAPLLLLMGIGGHLDMWLPLTEHLAGRRLVMFDKFEDAPETLRLTLWYQVEKSAGSPLEIILDSNEDKVGRIAAAQHEGRVSSTYPPVALLSLVRSTAMTWHTQIPELASLFPSDRRDRRDIVVRVIRQILDQ